MSTNYVDHTISTRVSTEFRRVVTGKTDVVALASGKERRNAAWAFKKMSFTANYAQLSRASQLEVASAFYACNAQLLLFRFRDFGDYQVVDSPFVVPADCVGFMSPVQLTNRYSFGPIYADRVIQAVVTCVVSIGGSPVEGEFDTHLGLFTPTEPWTSGAYSWSGTFDLWVRFNSDELDVTMSTLDIATADVELIEQTAYDSMLSGS